MKIRVAYVTSYDPILIEGFQHKYIMSEISFSSLFGLKWSVRVFNESLDLESRSIIIVLDLEIEIEILKLLS